MSLVELNPIGGTLGIWLVLDGLSTGGNGIIIYLLLLDLVWPMGRIFEVGSN